MLARKSRKNPVEIEPVKCELLKAAGYVRLSVNKIDEPSQSIENQMKIIEAYAKSNPDLLLERFYVDDNVSGRDFNRPAFNEMLEDIRMGKINCVIVKDLSRLGRNLIDVGYYVQVSFPSKGVRFISVGNQIDTLNGVTNITFGALPGLRIPLTALADEQIAVDIGKNIQYVINSYIEDGKLVAPRAPYGYRKSDSDCHKLVPDPEAAVIVKDIFSMAAQKIGINEIVRRLNTAGIPTPISYAISHGLKGKYDRGNGLWNSRSIKAILTNRTYVGDLEQGKDKYVVQNTHEYLVGRETFERVQQIIAETATANAGKTNIPRSDNVFRGKVICGCCGGKMQRRKGSGNADWHFFTCISNNRLGAGHCTGMYIRESDIIDAILREVRVFVRASADFASTYKNEIALLTAKAKQMDSEINQLMEMSKSRYEDFVVGTADKEDLQQCRNEREALQVELQDINSQIEMLNQKNEQCLLFHGALNDKQKIDLLITGYLENITILSSGQSDIQWNELALI